jgi:hypothetical protein
MFVSFHKKRALERALVELKMLSVVHSTGVFVGTPIDALGSADGRTAYVAFADKPLIAAVDLESQTVRYLPATENGSAGFTIGLSNNVCH